MSVRLGERGQVPNWISENDWSAEARLHHISLVMSSSPRDWALQADGDSDYPDAETWAIWCLSCCKTKAEALESWYGLCDQYRRAFGELVRI